MKITQAEADQIEEAVNAEPHPVVALRDFVAVRPREDGNWTIVLGQRGIELPIENGEINELASILFAMGFGENR